MKYVSLRGLVVISSIGTVAVCSLEHWGNMFIGYWIALITVGLCDAADFIDKIRLDRQEKK